MVKVIVMVMVMASCAGNCRTGVPPSIAHSSSTKDKGRRRHGEQRGPDGVMVGLDLCDCT